MRTKLGSPIVKSPYKMIKCADNNEDIVNRLFRYVDGYS